MKFKKAIDVQEYAPSLCYIYNISIFLYSKIAIQVIDFFNNDNIYDKVIYYT